MLVARRIARAARRRHWALWLGAAAVVLPLLSLLPYMLSGTEAARARNSLVLDDAADANVDWTPPQVPPGFLVDHVPADPVFVAIAQRLHLAELPTDWDRAVAISRHLLGSSPTLPGGAIQADLQTTYRRIIGTGDGYCVDFVQSFSAIAGAAGMPIRSWAFSFDGFGGHGHILPEIWNRQTGEWQMLDLFNNAYFTTADKPLSAREFRAAMLAGRDIRMHRLDPVARPGYIHEEKAWDYYRRGLPEWYLWWGNNPFSYDQAASVRMFSPLARSLAQLGAMVQGVHPHIHVLATAENRARIDALRRVRLHLWSVVASVLAGLVVIAVTLVRQRSGHGPSIEGAVGA
ncbi:MAG TPA: transglutaminase domain-containing protein [Albitalea sp.]|nr:transglutaminase domain-containing protein [Albitalea sp.]